MTSEMKKIGHATTHHLIIDPTVPLTLHVNHLHAHTTSPQSPLAHYFSQYPQLHVTSEQISLQLKKIATLFVALAPRTSAAPNVSTHSLCAGGATALFCTEVPIEQIRLWATGNWTQASQ
jgi:hypothetical protein